MLNDKLCVRDWIDQFNNGDFNAKNKKIQIEAGWYDWFCSDKALAGKTKVLGPKVKRISRSPKINVDTMYVWFKNNCPLYGKLYDDFRFADIETGDVIYTIIPKEGHTANKYASSIWGRENDFNEPLYTGDWKGVLKWFGV